ncbi:MAG: GNAT family N-acetyltransferase [Clostridia bacterium]|nr:GNAT family N-acetyltransferase [Clostridia bacterium]
MFKFNMNPTDEYERLAEFFKANGVAMGEGTLLKAWKITQAEDFLVAGLVFGENDGKFYVLGLAVDRILRKFGLGKILINKAKDEAKKRGGNGLYVLTSVPEFFLKKGFSYEAEGRTENGPFLMKTDL